ncbi:MAG: CDP-glucose 4,6-dehydratase, partial [Methanobrevibacter sp.]|nr:CDP-glucose 4,6-dehydratase [Methanobrevibacter sp.]
MKTDYNFWKNKKVFLTGHTGFKGAWLAFILNSFGSEVTGYSLEPPTKTNLFTLINLNQRINSIIGDIRDKDNLKKIFNQCKPDIVFHLAAQPIVMEGYKNPAVTYDINIMGTVNILECVRKSKSVRSFVNVTTDKVYHNNEWCYGYRETDPLDGIDPYSNSKSCSELVTACYQRSFFSNNDSAAISTTRAGNVIGGGDFAAFRIIPDCIRAALSNKIIEVRNPNSIRPYQHVLEPLFAYMMIAEAQYSSKKFADNYNIGPDESDCITTSELVNIFCENWGNNLTWKNLSVELPHEANFLKLDCSKIKSVFGWKPRWNIKTAIEKTVEWTKFYKSGA